MPTYQVMAISKYTVTTNTVKTVGELEAIMSVAPLEGNELVTLDDVRYEFFGTKGGK